MSAARYRIVLEVEAETNPAEWIIDERLTIDEPLTILSIERVEEVAP